jgi:hypothetical protein
LPVAPRSILQSQNHRPISRNGPNFSEKARSLGLSFVFSPLFVGPPFIVQWIHKLFWYCSRLLKGQFSLLSPIETPLTFCISIICSVAQLRIVRAIRGDGQSTKLADRGDRNDRDDTVVKGESTFQWRVIIRLIKSRFENHESSQDLVRKLNERMEKWSKVKQWDNTKIIPVSHKRPAILALAHSGRTMNMHSKVQLSSSVSFTMILAVSGRNQSISHIIRIHNKLFWTHWI